MTDDPKTSIAAGMASLMKRATRDTLPPEEREARDRAEAQRLRDAALIYALNVNNALWWVFVERDWDGLGNDAYHDLEWRDGGVGWARIIPSEDAEPFDLFKVMEPEAQRRYLDKMRGAAIPPAIHPMQLADPITGEFSRVAA